MYKAPPRDRRAWITLVLARHTKAEVGPAGPPNNSSSRLQGTRDARDMEVAAASSDWVVDETQPLPSNSSDDLTLQLRLDRLPMLPMLQLPYEVLLWREVSQYGRKRDAVALLPCLSPNIESRYFHVSHGDVGSPVCSAADARHTAPQPLEV